MVINYYLLPFIIRNYFFRNGRGILILKRLIHNKKSKMSSYTRQFMVFGVTSYLEVHHVTTFDYLECTFSQSKVVANW